MSKYEFKATNLIAETFERRSIKFDVVNRSDHEQVLAGFSVHCGPLVTTRFICDNDNDVQVRMYGLISRVPKDKRPRMMEACNILNAKVRYIKFYLDTDGDLNAEYDFPQHIPDEAVGEIAAEIFIRLMLILEGEYSIFTKALYTEEDLDCQEHHLPRDLLQMLLALQNMAEARTTEDGAEDDGEFELAADAIDLSDEFLC